MKNPLYIFDFDETLVSDTATIYLIDAQGNRRPISVSDYHYYQMKPGEQLDTGEFNEVVDPKPHLEMFTLLRKYLPNSAILTAREKSGPIRKYMNEMGIAVPEIIAIGVHEPGKDSNLINAQRKSWWVAKVIKERDLDYVEFWDDNPHNVELVQNLEKKFPGVVIVTHKV